MSDDLAAKAANWVPPWQRPADGESSDGEAGPEASGGEAGSEASGGAAEGDEGPGSGPDSGSGPESGLPAQWDRLAGAKWQTMPPGESPDGESLDDAALDDAALDDAALDQELSDPQLTDCVSEDDVDDEDLDDGHAGSWNARAASPDTDDAVDEPEDLSSGDEPEDLSSGDEPEDLSSEDEPEDLSTEDEPEDEPEDLSTEDEPEDLRSGDEQGVGAQSPDSAARSEDEPGADARSGDEPDAVAPLGDAQPVGAWSSDSAGLSGDEPGGSARSGDERGAAGLSGDEPGSSALSADGQGAAAGSGSKRSRSKRSGGGENQPQDDGSGAAGGLFAQGQLFVPAQRVAEDTPSISEADLVPALEAILMVVDEPVGEMLLAQVLDVPAEQVANALLGLSARYTEEGKGFDLRRAAGGWRFYTRAEYSAYVERFVLDGQQLRLTQASLETLAVVAYKQPVTRSRISAIRGVNCDGVVRTLITRGLIEECGTEPESGAHLYKTTNLFLEKLGLDSVAQLPPLAPFLPDNLDEVALHE